MPLNAPACTHDDKLQPLMVEDINMWFCCPKCGGIFRRQLDAPLTDDQLQVMVTDEIRSQTCKTEMCST